MQWWIDLMPPEIAGPDASDASEISYQGKTRLVTVPAHLHEEPVLRGAGPILHHVDVEAAVEELEEDDEVVAALELHGPPADPDLVMLIRPRKSRIYYLRKFF